MLTARLIHLTTNSCPVSPTSNSRRVEGGPCARPMRAIHDFLLVPVVVEQGENCWAVVRHLQLSVVTMNLLIPDSPLKNRTWRAQLRAQQTSTHARARRLERRRRPGRAGWTALDADGGGAVTGRERHHGPSRSLLLLLLLSRRLRSRLLSARLVNTRSPRVPLAATLASIKLQPSHAAVARACQLRRPRTG